MQNILFLFFILSVFGCGNNYDPNTENWESLFNGKDLNDWEIKINGFELGDNFGETFFVEDSLLKVQYVAYDTFDSYFGHIFHKNKYSYYRLKVEYRFIGDQVKGGPSWAFRNSGVMLHSQSAASMKLNQGFPICIEAQFLGGADDGERSTANLCTPGTHVYLSDTLNTDHCINSSSKTYRGDQWVSTEFVVLGDSLIQHLVEGEVVLEYAKPHIGGGGVNDVDEKVMKDGQPLTEGYIALQSESHPVEFRKVEILDLCGCMDTKAKNYKTYFIKADNTKCMY